MGKYWLAGIVLLAMAAGIASAQAGPVFPGDKSKFVRDVNFPDDNGVPQVTVKPGQRIDKEWEVENAGSVHWEERQLRPLNSSAGKADLGRIKPSKIPETAPGKRCILKATLFAPKTPGRYRVDFKMTDKKGRALLPAQSPVYVVVTVAK